MKLSRLAYWIFPLALICGCQTVVELEQPANIPVFVDEYGKPLLVQKTHAVPCMLNLVNCPEKATKTPHPTHSCGFSSMYFLMA